MPTLANDCRNNPGRAYSAVRLLGLGLLLALAWLLPQPAQAMDCDTLVELARGTAPTETRLTAVNSAYRQGCLDHRVSAVPAADALDAMLHRDRFESVAGMRVAAADLARQVAAKAQERAQALEPPAGEWFAAMADGMRAAATGLTDAHQPGTGATAIDYWELHVEADGRWRLPATESDALPGDAVDTACETPGPDCDAAMDTLLDLLAQARAMERLVDVAVQRIKLAELQTRLTRYDRQWTAYFTEARSQMPWELAFNAWRFRANREQYCEPDGGFCAPPAHQWILLHPGIALEYLEGQPSGARVEEALTLEIIGFNRWSWGDDGGTGRAFGASLVATATDRASAPVLGMGVMAHFNHRFSLGVTHRSGDTGIFLSYDFWRTSQHRAEQLQARFTRMEQIPE